MGRLRVSIDIDAAPAEVWAVLSDVGSHVEWMEDAVAIRFTSDRTSGVGTEFDCDTRIGPFSLVDHMEITEWVPERAMGVRHVGLVTGSGVMTLEPTERGQGSGFTGTRFAWTERLIFPWWMGGPLGATASLPVLDRVWRRSLENLKAIVEERS